MQEELPKPDEATIATNGNRPILKLSLKPAAAGIDKANDKPQKQSQKTQSADTVTQDLPPTPLKPSKNKQLPKQAAKKRMPKEQYNEMLKMLQAKYPNVFSQEVKILSLNIHNQLAQELGLSKTIARKFLSRYCTSKRYKAAHITEASRYDLSGNVTGQVTAEESEQKSKN